MDERRLLLKNYRNPEARRLDWYLRHENGYASLDRLLATEPKHVIEEVKKSGLRGRGGAGFPTGLKWWFVPRDSEKPRYLVCNADESEPGTFKDRALMEWDPHQVIEGMVIGSYAIGARVAYLYIRCEYNHVAKIMEEAIAEAEGRGFLGRNIRGRGYDLEIHVVQGAGAYICGEETGLLESLEGKRPYPRNKPPFPASVGLWGCPTVINNVETLANLPHIINHGGEWYAALGRPNNTGTRIYCVSGHVEKPGLYEFEMAPTMRELVYEHCGGIRDGRRLKAVIPGGSSTPAVTADEIDVIMDFDSLAAIGTQSGSAGVIVMDETVDMAKAALNLARFYAHESCGQCTPCREGTHWLVKILERFDRGEGQAKDLDLLYSVSDRIEGNTVCPLGDAAAWPIKAFVTKFRGDFERRLGLKTQAA